MNTQEISLAMAKEIRTQDNRMTSFPQYRVMDGKETVEIFFTNKCAEAFVEQRKHDYENGLHIYISSGWRNEEWQAVRSLLESLDKSGGKQ